MSLPLEAHPYVTRWLGDGWTAEPLAGDASVRAYYRIAAPDGSTYMLAYYPEEVRPQLQRFLGAYEAVAGHGRIPEVLQSCELAVLQRDVGDRTLYDVLHEHRDEGILLYHDAIDLLVDFQQSAQDEINPPFTAEFFYGELEMAREFYVEKLMGGDVAGLEPHMKMLCEEVARHPYVLCHRDYHGQNIHIVNDELFLIDYQDLRMGPDTYDIASLLRDRGVAVVIGDEVELELLEYYRERIGAGDDLRRRYFETLLQRSIKILGTWAKQFVVRRKTKYLDFIPPTMESIHRCIVELPEFRKLGDVFR